MSERTDPDRVVFVVRRDLLRLTTAFVIFEAWRRAVRDAEVDAVGEGE